MTATRIMWRGIVCLAILGLAALVSGCGWFGWNSSGFGIRTITGAVGTRAVGFNVDDTKDAISFRSSDISFWALESVEDIDRIYSNPTTEISDTIIALRYDLGDTNIQFENGKTVDTIVGEVPDFDLARSYNFIRIDIGFGFIGVEDDGVSVEHLYDAYGNELIIQDNDLVDTGINCNSIVLVDDTWVSTPFYCSREDEHLFDPADYALYGLTAEEAQVYGAILSRGRSDGTGLDINGAFFLPFTPDEFDPAEEVESVTIEFVWEMAGAFEPYADGYRMVDRTGNGLSLDFDVRIVINE